MTAVGWMARQGYAMPSPLSGAEPTRIVNWTFTGTAARNGDSPPEGLRHVAEGTP